MTKTIGLCLFGHNKKNHKSFSFETFLSFLTIDIRAYRSLYVGWDIYLAIDQESYDEYQDLFNYLIYEKLIDKLDVFKPELIGRAALWRFNPIKWSDYTISRDVDSLPTYRERQCVEIWMNKNTIAHSINDNPAHSIPLLAGMVGFKKNAFELSLINYVGIDYNNKGGDQDFLNSYVYNIVKDSIVEHRIKGMPTRKENPYSYDYIDDIDVDVNLNLESGENKNDILKRSNKIIEYMGQAGIRKFNHLDIASQNFFEGALCFWNKYCNSQINSKLFYIENKYPNVFWTKNDLIDLCQR